METFNSLNLSNPLLNALEDLEYFCPTPIQAKCFPIIMSGKDVIGIAQTGTGKTFAYLLPILRQLKYSEQKHPRVLIIVPTRELVLQIVNEIEKLTKYMTIRFQGVYGGTNISTQKQIIYNGVDILVATPGRLYDLAMSGILRLKSIQKLVIDEVDQLLDMGFRQELMTFMETLPQKRQNLLFSATINEDVEKIIDNWLINPLKIEIEPYGTPLAQISQVAYQVPNFYTKINLLNQLLSNKIEFNKVLIFCNSKKNTDKLQEELQKKTVESIGAIHSNKSQNQRINTINNFREGKIRILIASDIAARGLHINDVSHVINFDTPELPEEYLHRIGRTGRADKHGNAISFVIDSDSLNFQNIEDLMNLEITYLDMPEEIEISNQLTEEERKTTKDKNIFKFQPKLNSKGAFHEKLEKNKKVNLKIDWYDFYKNKPSNRSAQKKKK